MLFRDDKVRRREWATPCSARETKQLMRRCIGEATLAAVASFRGRRRHDQKVHAVLHVARFRMFMVVAVGVFGCVGQCTAMADDTAPPQPDRPKIKTDRWREDWSSLAHPENRTHALDRLKYIALSDSYPDRYVSFGLTVREIFESSDAPALGTMQSNPRDSYGLQRAQLHLDARFAEHWQLFTQVEDVRAFEKKAVGSTDANRFDLRLAFLAYSRAWDKGVFSARVGRQELADADPVGQAAFGALWQGAGTDIDSINGALAWIKAHGPLRQLAADIADPIAKRDEGKALLARGQALEGEVTALFATLAFSGTSAVQANASEASVKAIAEQLRAWQADPEGLPQWVAYLAQTKLARRLGLGAFVDLLDAGQLAPDRVRGAFDLAYQEAVLAAMVARDRVLGQFDGKHQSQLVESFSQLDRDRIDLARRQVSAVHRSNIPLRGGAAGPTAVLMGEMAKKRSHLPIRQLMSSAAPAIQALKPVFMMSPLSVAQFLPPGAVEFDLLVVDEASQVQPIDALGAIARAKQIVVVGDERQLPPTRFFAKALGDGGDGQDDDGAQAADVESILGLCRARGLPERMLRWHYRSRHQSLIAVSNSQFYENKLFIVPSPYTSEAGVGLRFHHLADAVYDRGNTRTNPKEARTIARAVIEHAQTTPHLTLGVATFSTQQRRAVFDEIELLRRQHPETEGFFAAHAHEPFFVKSLENIQGDERDVILISIGYGRDAHGNVSMNFGPVSNEGGERRLNVLISRAKSRCEVFSSITDEDIDLQRGRGKGTAALKLFMHYARTGRSYLASDSDDQKTAVFEQEVATALRSRGYDLHTNVGVAGFFIDIAVANPEKPGRYVLGIECDGGSYRDARSARDRDRLREQALRDKGWNVHRVWSSEWFRRPAAELDALVAAIEAAKLEPDPFEVEAVARARAVPVDFESTEHEGYVEVGLIAAEATPAEAYVEAFFGVPRQQYELHLVPQARMAAIVRDVVQIESPIHQSEVVARIRGLWDLQRTGGRIQAAVEDGIAHAVRERMVSREGEFLLWPGREVRVRDRSQVVSNTLRRPELLPPMEMDVAIMELVKENLGATLDEVALHVSRRLGYRTTSAQLRAALIGRAELLVAQGALELRGATLMQPTR